MSKRVWIVLFVLLTVIVSSCAPAQTVSAPTQPAAQEAAPAATQPPAPAKVEPTKAPVVEKVKLTIWDFGGSEFQWLDDTAIPEFNKAYPNIEIVHVGVPEEELGLKVETAIAAGEPPDLTYSPSARLVKAGHVLYLDEYMTRDNVKVSDMCGQFEGENMLDGKVYGLAVDTNVMFNMYNKDLFDAAGIKAPTVNDYYTYDDWLSYLRAVNKPAADIKDRVWGGLFLWPPYNAMFHYQSDPYVLGNNGRSCVGNADTKDWIHVWDVLLKAWDEDLTTETAGAMLTDVQQDMFLQGKMGMNWAALGDVLTAKAQGINVGVMGQPMVTKGWVNNAGGWTTSYGIMSATKHPQEAWLFLKWLATEGPKYIPIGADAVLGGKGGLMGLPCYQPLMKEQKFVQMMKDEPFVAAAAELVTHTRPRPMSPDLWTVTDPYFEAFRQMSEDRMPVEQAVKDATLKCQELLDQGWAEFDALGK